jgi:predicted nuclease with RNAse H fold
MVFSELLDVVDKLNRGQVMEAAHKIIELARDREDLIEMCSEIEEMLMDLRRGRSLEVEGPLGRKLREVEEEMRRLKVRRLKLLILYAVQLISGDNPIIMNVIKREDIDTTHTYL